LYCHLTLFQVEYPFDKTDIFAEKKKKGEEGKCHAKNTMCRRACEEDGGTRWESKGKKR
jgi:hypothetical protein